MQTGVLHELVDVVTDGFLLGADVHLGVKAVH